MNTINTLNKNSVAALPPHAPEAEAGALGCILCAPQPAAAVRLLARLEEGLFYDLRHRRAFHALRALQQAGQPLETDAGTVTEEDMQTLFQGGRRHIARRQAVKELMERTRCCRAVACQACSGQGKFGSRLTEDAGLLRWRD